jgi:hypothetical protein
MLLDAVLLGAREITFANDFDGLPLVLADRNQAETERSLRIELPNPALHEPHEALGASIAELDKKANVLGTRL